MAADLPSGTVTFLFTDIEASTRLLQELGDGYADVLAEHRRAVRSALADHHGVEVDTQGDAFFATFASARDAAAAAGELQRALADGPARARIGLHTGEAAVGPEGYVGLDVHRASRICAAAHGGQVLVSQSTRDLIDAPTRDLGEHRLKDLTAPQRLHQLVIDGLPDEFPPPATLDIATTNLPVEPTALVGRERELREAGSLLARDEVRLLTLTGPAGAGKTRLAVQLAAEVVDEFQHGVYLVDLSSLRDPDLIVPAVGQTVGLRESSGQPVQEALAEFLGEKRMLLVVDNVEHVVQGAPDLGRLLAACPRLEVVATSREPLRIAGEQEYPVPPLSADESVELFAERARAVRPGFDVDGNRSTIAEICARLDGLPLAIELAAARVKLLPPPKLLERLEQRLPLLTTGARDAPERQQTLRAAIDWSFELLEPDEQDLFTRLSVFEGGCTLESAEAVSGATIDGLASLVDKSLLAEREGAGGEPRFAMLETVLEYAREHLERSGERDALRRRHAEHFLDVAEDAREVGADAVLDRDRLYDELANTRAALAWFAEADDVESELRLAYNTTRVLYMKAFVPELLHWLVSAIARGEDADRGVLADALGSAALAAYFVGDIIRSRRTAEQSLELARELADKRRIEWALRILSFYEEDLHEQQRLLRECESILRELDDDVGLAWVSFLLAQSFLEGGEIARGRETSEETVSLFERQELRWETANARVQLALALRYEHRREDAFSVLEEALRAMVELDVMPSIAECLVVLAALRLEDDASAAVRLLGAAARIREAYADHSDRIVLELAGEAEAGGRQQLSEDYERELDAGRALSNDEAVALALGALRGVAP